MFFFRERLAEKVVQINQDKLLGGLWGAIVADALGVPVEFRGREELRIDPVIDMREYGTHHQPEGTWSDDSSLLLCTIDSLLHQGFDTNEMGQQFVGWYSHNHWTPWGKVFDIGIATATALSNIKRGVAPEQAGGNQESDNGNGSLMRILPVALYFANAPLDQLLDYAHRASCLTHRHLRSQMACGFYCVLATELLKGVTPAKAYQQTIEAVLPYYQQSFYLAELPKFERVFSGKLADLKEEDIKSSGYVIHTLEASIWCLLNSQSYAQAVLKAVNLGEDTDTTGIVTGGLAGLYFGLNTIPDAWLKVLARREDLAKLLAEFVEGLQKG